MTGGCGQELSSSNPAEWNRLRGLVEERLGNLKGIDEKASLPQSEKGQLGKGITEDNVPKAAPGQQSHPSTENAENTLENGVATQFRSRLGLT
jgi:hypothetical protein